MFVVIEVLSFFAEMGRNSSKNLNSYFFFLASNLVGV